MQQRVRVAAYAVCERDGLVLMARWISPDGTQRHWTLPGGKVEHGEDPYDAVVREVAEETGYRVTVMRLLGVDSRHRLMADVDLHHVGIFYLVSVIGGEIRNEVGGSTDLAEWISAAEIRTLERAALVDVGLELAYSLPPEGHVPAIAVERLLRH